jgi:glycosyltransferase involved in cell wall biosynthesis
MPSHCQTAPTVSVILATYNWTSVLRYAIRTVLWQNFQDFELLVIGDGCTDDSADVVASFGDPRIRWHNLPQSSGNQAGPNNAGLAMARGPYVAYMHQDDLWLPDHLDLLVNAMRSHDAPLAHTLVLEVSPPPQRLRRVAGLPGTGGFGAEKVRVWTPAVMHRTDAGRQVGGWRDWRSIYEPTFADFLKRVVGPEENLITVKEISVVKFHSGQRPNSYIDRRCEEQAEYFDRIQSEPDFRYRELLRAMEVKTRGLAWGRAIPEPPADARPGWHIDQLHRIRGLAGSELQPPDFKRRVSNFVIASMRLTRDQIPLSVRRRAGRFLTRTGAFLERCEGES